MKIFIRQAILKREEKNWEMGGREKRPRDQLFKGSFDDTTMAFSRGALLVKRPSPDKHCKIGKLRVMNHTTTVGKLLATNRTSLYSSQLFLQLFCDDKLAFHVWTIGKRLLCTLNQSKFALCHVSFVKTSQNGGWARSNCVVVWRVFDVCQLFGVSNSSFSTRLSCTGRFTGHSQFVGTIEWYYVVHTKNTSWWNDPVYGSVCIQWIILVLCSF